MCPRVVCKSVSLVVVSAEERGGKAISSRLATYGTWTPGQIDQPLWRPLEKEKLKGRREA